jgi:glycosyltransferase involved in cell wall biosynthesis
MTIYINGKFLTQRLTGVQRYAFEITRALISLNANVKVIVPSFLDIATIDLPQNSLVSVGGFRNSILWEQFAISRFLHKKSNYILLNLCNVGTLFNRNQIVCIHDMTYKANPKWFSRTFRAYYSFIIPRLIKLAKRVITVSEFSKNEISKQLQVSCKNISVVYNAPSDKFVCRNADDIVYNKEDFFLFVGSMHPRKNINLLVQLFSLEEFRQRRLIVVGAKAKAFGEVNLTLPANVTILDKCNDDQLSDLYAKAKAMINPSIYEGFGIPVVEAMASGCPLIISDLAVFKEIAKEGAEYFNPYSLEALKDAFQRFLAKSSEEVNHTIRLNYYQSQSFTWKKSSTVLLDLINEL